MLAPSSGMSEDPITGSLSAAVAHWFAYRDKLGKTLLVRQGTVINRSAHVGPVFHQRIHHLRICQRRCIAKASQVVVGNLFEDAAQDLARARLW